jgi:hypothetical protein
MITMVVFMRERQSKTDASLDRSTSWWVRCYDAGMVAAKASTADVLALVDEVEDMDPDEMKRAREVWEKYGDDLERRRADLEAGRHPFQQPR